MRIAKVVLLSIILICGALSIGESTPAQGLTGTLRGVVLDQQGKTVPNATVTMMNENTNASMSTATSSAGVYAFADVVNGTYRVKVDAPGFASSVRTGIQVASSQITDVTITMELPTTTTTVVVESGANVVQTESSQLSGTFEGKSISQIPILTGQFGTVLNLAIFLTNTTT